MLWPGCAQEVLAPSINAAAIHMLTANGVEVVIPPSLGCCGAIAAHTGALEQASRLATRALEVLGRHTDVDGVITTAAGCGSGIHEYPVWLAGSGHEADAVRLAGRTVDVTVFLARLGLTTPLALEKPARVAYHDACHLLHGQGVREAPRDLLRAVDGLELVELDDEACCGSAGTFNLEQPDLAWTLGRRKAERIQALGVSEVATGNIGCLTQMHAHLAGASRPVRVRHTVEVLAEACREV
ncbi:MAG: (Fe-S)-binding protein [Vicinamibacterales bacterium]